MPEAAVSWKVVMGDCVEVMAAMPEASVDAIVTDPPYGIGFMGHEWDQPGVEVPARRVGVPSGNGARRRTQPSPGTEGFGSEGGGAKEAGRYDLSRSANHAFQAWCEAWAREALRVLKPGGHLLVFGGTRTYHRLAAGVEDAGFEIRDCLAWMFGSGFPKSLDVSKAIDKAEGAQREVVGKRNRDRNWRGAEQPDHERYAATAANDPGGSAQGHVPDGRARMVPITAPATDQAARWEGWGTALKPAFEPVVVARKPLTGTVAANVLEHGTGALNVDGCRIDGQPRNPGFQDPASAGMFGGADNAALVGYESPAGRWPANVALDEDAARVLDEQTGELPAGVAVNRNREPGTRTSWMGTRASQVGPDVGYADRGGASRFFYCAKASSAERNAGLDGFDAVERANGNKWTDRDYRVASGERAPGRESGPRRNVHPTVKPIDLMRWLVRLVTPPGGLVLDPFAGSGTTGCAAVLEGAKFVGIEREAEYVRLAEARIAHWATHGERALAVGRKTLRVNDLQDSLFE